VSKEEKRKEYLDAIEKKAKETPEIRRIIEETKSHKLYLSKDLVPDKDKEKE